MPGRPRVESPEVIAKAEKWGVDLTEVRASGADDRITGDDVFRTALAKQIGLPVSASVPEILAATDVLLAAKRRREQAAAAARQATAAAASEPPLASRVADKGPRFALNPLVDQVRAQAAAGKVRMPASSAPSLFASGDLPVFTASGIPPRALLDVPWEARHAMAAASTQAEAYAIASHCRTEEGVAAYAGHPGNEDYRHRATQWQLGALTDAELSRTSLPGASDEAARREQALGAQPLPDGEGEQIDGFLHGLGAI